MANILEKAKINNGGKFELIYYYYLVIYVPSWPSSLSPQVKTSPWSVQATQCSDPVAIDMTFFPCKAATFFGLRTWSSLP